jgi:hypothetical protein
MKNFFVYSKKPLKDDFSIKEALNIRLLKRGIRILYFVDIIGFFYALYNKFYSLAFVIFMVGMSSIILTSLDSLEQYSNYIETSVFVFHVALVIFGLEIEEFFLKRRKFKMEGFIIEKNLTTAREKLDNSLKIKYTKQNSVFIRFLLGFKKLYQR